MTLSAFQFRQRIEEMGKLKAAQSVDNTVKNEQQADLLIFRYIARLLGVGQYYGAAVVLWGTGLFDPRPMSVRAIWNEIEHGQKVMVMAAGGVGKSYSAMVWLLLDWLRDPEFTSCKIISVTAAHASSNTFSTLVRLHRNAIVKLPGFVSSEYIGLDPKEKKSGIAIVAIPVGQDGRGRLKGFHPDPRPKPHPVLGPNSRIRVVLDEGEDAPVGVWEGIDNVTLTLGDGHAIKVICIFNPKNPTSVMARNAMPEEGWDWVDIDTGYRGKNRWRSKNEWNVLRIDAKYTENIQQRKLIYHGFIDYPGFRTLEAKDGGNSVDYYSQARGIYPPEGATGTIVSSKLLSDSRGEFVFSVTPVKCGSVDTAVDGRDNCVFTLGLSGMATAFKHATGKVTKFKEPRHVIQAEQQYSVAKGSTKIVGDNIIKIALTLGVSPEYLCVDATGNGSAVYSYIKAVWGDDAQGVDFNKPATEIKILEQDQFTPNELYEGIVSEVWFALAKLMEFGFFAISPGMKKDPLDGELTSRKYTLGQGKKLRVEKKDDYRKRIGAGSPDWADSLTLLPACIRMRGALMGSMVDEKKSEESPEIPISQPVSHGDEAVWLDESV